MLDNLPNELVIEILKRSTIDSIAAMIKVDKRTREIYKNNEKYILESIFTKVGVSQRDYDKLLESRNLELVEKTIDFLTDHYIPRFELRLDILLKMTLDDRLFKLIASRIDFDPELLYEFDKIFEKLSEDDVIAFFHFLHFELIPTDDFNFGIPIRDIVKPYINSDFIDFLVYDGGIDEYIFNYLPIYDYSHFWQFLNPSITKKLLELMEISDRDNFNVGDFNDLVVRNAKRENNVVFIQGLRDTGLYRLFDM